MTDNERGAYFFRVHSYATGGRTPNDKFFSVGHFGIELIDPNGKSLNLGLYPKTKADPESKNTGIIRNDGEMKAEFSNLESSEKITLTPEQGEKMRAFLINAMENPGDYSLLGRNCEEFVQEALKASGIKAKTRDFMTPEQHKQFNLAKFTMVDPIERDLDTAGSMEYEGFHSAFDLEQKQPAPDQPAPDQPAPDQPGLDQRSDADDASQQQQFADANADAGTDPGINPGIDTGGGNNGRNYAAELAALPLGRAVSVNWLLEKSPDQWTQRELDDAQASDAYWNSRNPRHGEVQNAVTGVYDYLYGNGIQSFRPDGSLPRLEAVNRLAADPGSPTWQSGQEATLRANRADLGMLMEDFPRVDGSEAARNAPGRFLQQALNAALWPGKAAPDAASIQGKPYRNGPILVDGEIGPVTAQALDQVEAMPGGLSALTHDMKRIAAQDLVQRLPPEMPPEDSAEDSAGAQDLAGLLDQAVNIFRDLNRSHDGSVRHLQKGLNQLGRQSMGQQSMGQQSTGLNETWQPIAEDGQLGPVTAKSFATLARRLPADSMASLFDLGTPPSVGGAGNRKGRAASQMSALSSRDPNPRQRLRAGMV